MSEAATKPEPRVQKGLALRADNGTGRLRRFDLVTANPMWNMPSKNNPSAVRLTGWKRMLLAGLSLTLLCVYLRYWLDPQLLYGADKVVLRAESWIDFPFFLSGWDFFWERVTHPGGLMGYVADGAQQYFFYSWGGPLILTAIVGAVLMGAAGMMRALESPSRPFLLLVAATLLIVAFNRYTFGLAGHFGLVTALAATLTYIWGVQGRQVSWPLRAATFTLFSVPVYYAVGGAYVLVAGGCGLFELRRGRHRALGIAYLVAAPVFPLACLLVRGLYAAGVAFDAPGTSRISEAFPAALPSAAYAALLAAVLTAAAVRRRVTAADAIETRSEAADRPRRRPLSTLLLIVAAGLAVLVTPDRPARTLLRANHFARQARWPEFLQELASNPPRAFPPGLLYDINRAFFETGHMGDRMFSLPQSPEFGLGLTFAVMHQRSYHETLLQLGCVNEAEHALHESLEVIGSQPYVLWQLADINLTKGRPRRSPRVSQRPPS